MEILSFGDEAPTQSLDFSSKKIIQLNATQTFANAHLLFSPMRNRKVHDGSIFTLCSLKDGALISGGGKDGRLVVFDADLNPTGIECEIEHHFGAVRVVAEGKGSQILVGTTRNCILTGALDLGFSPVIMGHTDELWGLAVHPNLPQFVTGGRDRLLQLWDSLSHSVVWSKDIGEQIQSCAFSASGNMIAVGTVNGKWLIYDTLTREALAQHTDGQEPIQVIRFSPDGNLVAIGSRDNNVYMYQIGDGHKRFAKVGKCSVSIATHNSASTHCTEKLNTVIRSFYRDIPVLFCTSIGPKTVKLSEPIPVTTNCFIVSKF